MLTLKNICNNSKCHLFIHALRFISKINFCTFVLFGRAYVSRAVLTEKFQLCLNFKAKMCPPAAKGTVHSNLVYTVPVT